MSELVRENTAALLMMCELFWKGTQAKDLLSQDAKAFGLRSGFFDKLRATGVESYIPFDKARRPRMGKTLASALACQSHEGQLRKEIERQGTARTADAAIRDWRNNVREEPTVLCFFMIRFRFLPPGRAWET